MYRIVQNLNKKSLDQLISSMFLFNLCLSTPVVTVTVKIFMLSDMTLLHVQLEDEKRSFKHVFVSAPNGEEEKVKERFVKEGISPSQLIVRSAKEREQPAQELCQADLVIMPSRTEGFWSGCT